MVHFGMVLPSSILISSVFCFLLPAAIFKQNFDFSVGAIVTISASMQHINAGPSIRMTTTRTADENHPVTTGRT